MLVSARAAKERDKMSRLAMSTVVDSGLTRWWVSGLKKKATYHQVIKVERMKANKDRAEK